VIDALTAAGVMLDVIDYSEHAIGHGSDAQAAAYLECRTSGGRTVFGVGIDSDVATATVRAALGAANRS
jgi:2-isopropylmalate synthase